jgi:hypothetical protein
MFQGDVLKWRKFANSLRLRFLLRLSEKIADAGIDVKAEFNAIVSDNAGSPIFTANSDNAAVAYIGAAAANSWYGGPLWNSNRSEFYRRKPCAPFVDALRTGMDPRLTTLIRPVDVQLKVSSATPTYQIVGGQMIRNVSASPDINTYRYVGLPVALPDPNLFNLLPSVDFNAIKALNPNIYTEPAANPSVSYLADMYAQNANSLVNCVFMSYADLNFTLAEARLKGWISTSTAVDYYQAGVLASMQQYAIADGDLKVYNPANDALIAWNQTAFLADLATKFTSAATDDDRLAQLMTQKWLAGFMTPEFWFDWRRTGLPDLGANVIQGSNGNKIPVRMIYPSDELSLNSKNVADAVTRLAPGENTQWAKMWLLQGTNKPW